MEKPEIKQFNIRVYGLVINANNQVLLSDEFVYNRKMTKFPGGGMQFGEGPVDCVKREFLEEFGQEVEVLEHFYTTHFFQRALFFEDHQLISIYYTVAFKDAMRFKVSDKPFDFPLVIDGSQSFRWAGITALVDDELSFPIDRYVLKLLKDRE